LKKAFTILGILLLAGAALVLVGYLMMSRMFGPRINAVDNDPYLTSVARPALPLIQALEHYYSEHHQYPDPTVPTELEAIEAMFPEAERGWRWNYEKNGWWDYNLEDPTTYHFYHKLNWDAILWYRCKDNEGHWEYDPGDGSRPANTIRLTFDTPGHAPSPTPPEVLRH